MQTSDSVLSSIGMAMRAGKITAGEDFVIADARKSKAKLVIIATDASERTQKKLIDKCTYYETPYVLFGTRETLGAAIGKFDRVVLGVLDGGFAKKIRSLLSDK
ncbi:MULTISPECIES: L7Ae/L30e/S12e/Gadd45 family ribosomal protein [Brochothrix]|uniref:K-turn RNA binding protein n=2 Tax=Brochothrix thermosphacta TaxID=2756 RepID=A0A1D2KQW7_BROTH|nr:MULTISPECIES: ribosomal L7Ae/L30e/S12e/Gadd45 family protein [Brochothrix]SLM98738.1 ribosomal protein L7Ae family protein [Brachybacterium faecium]ANZ94033.1 50S ribosomal protein L7 [Brochothrix thermosphacta]ANZ97670.1 50S ribosomal protein L7 [Brochothrix thermosphacta]ATF27119.1 hypothetical protein CNY62_12495 [Brochothrix thermosphacta]ATH86478.1 hypothetical protein CPF12_12185 [Brochothrix thermosphacta]